MSVFGHIRILAMDVDGTLTDGRIHMGPDGELFKSFDVRDGYAIAQMLPEMGIAPVIITARSSRIVERRCEELGVTRLYQGVSNKLEVLGGVCHDVGCTLADVCYMGDDLNDLPVIRAVTEAGGLGCCPCDARPEVRAEVTYACTTPGGHGSLRELADLLWSETHGKQAFRKRLGTLPMNCGGVDPKCT